MPWLIISLPERTHTGTSSLDIGRLKWNYKGSQDIGRKDRLGNRQKAWSHPLSDFEGRDTPSAEEEIQELARIIYAEAGGSDEQTKATVGWSVRNRVNKRGYPDTYTGVIHEKKNGKKQYEAVGGKRWNDAADPGNLNPIDYRDYRLSHELAKGVYSGSIPDRSGVEFFHSFKNPEKVTGFFGDAVKDKRIRLIERKEGMSFFKDNTR